MPDHYVRVLYVCRNGYEWDLIATVTQQVHPALQASPPAGVAGQGGLPVGACPPPSHEVLRERVTVELHSNRYPEHIRRRAILLRE
jgi:hypothetical protein